MAHRMASRLEQFFRDNTDGHLRSIVKYDQGDCAIEYLRDDVEEQYAAEEIEAAIDDSRLDSFSAPIYGNLYADSHGELTCLVKCFENAVEMNFVLDDGVGTAVALDSEAFTEAHGLVSDARDIVEQERSQYVEAQARD